ncbi:MAG: hypothetical protein ACE1Y4_12195, partial [Lysobacterales bacterium]
MNDSTIWSILSGPTSGITIMQRKCLRIGFTLTLLFLPAQQVVGRDAQPGSDDFEEVVVFATRIPTDITDLPFAVGRVGREQIQLARQQLGLDEA